MAISPVRHTPAARPVARAAGAHPRKSTVYEVTSKDVYVRTHAMGLVEGTLYKGQKFIAEYVSSKGWAWGYAKGHANKPGWMPLASKTHHNVKRVGTTDAHPVGAPTNLAKSEQIHYRHKKPYTLRAKVKKGHSLTLFGNYSKGKGPSDKIMTLKPGEKLGFRYKLNKDWAVGFKKAPHTRPIWGIFRLKDAQITKSK